MTTLFDNLEDEEYNNFYEALAFVISKEGGYVWNQKDPGGETKWGISKRYHPTEDIKNLTPERAAEIYYEEYWKPSGAAQLSQPLSTVVFDTAVLCGVGRARFWLRESNQDTQTFLRLRKQHHVTRVKDRPDQSIFLKGWINRCNDLSKFAEMKKAP